MRLSNEKALIQMLDKYGFHEIENCNKFNSLGQTWKLSEELGTGYFWKGDNSETPCESCLRTEQGI